MQKSMTYAVCVCATAGILTLITGCQTSSQSSTQAAPAVTQASAPTAVAAPSTAQASVASTQAVTQGVIRIRAGSSEPFKDSSGNVWQAEQGFDGGDVTERDSSLAIANTKDAGLYLSEHYGMNSFSCNVPNGKYLAKLHFAETFEGITGPGERVFTFNVQGREFKDFDVFAKAGGANRAYVESVPVEVTEGKFRITFTSNVENPEINAIELLAQK